MQNWEYQTLSFPRETWVIGIKDYEPQTLDNALNQLGQQGWELVSLVGIVGSHEYTSQIIATLKRPRS